MKIEIANPIGGRFCTPRNAERMVTQGKARWSGKRLEIVHAAHFGALACAPRSKRCEAAGYDEAVNEGRVATIEELRALPMIGNIARFLS